ncbi:MAG: O-antigen ligase family protein, partial [Thermodesulfobacteria bacterium]|nr:O-antigen ligase family protein [Thermodesulfobacteriota bacterium]
MNLVIRVAVLHDQGNNIPLLALSMATLFLLFSLNKHNVFRWFCFVLGLSFPFYCYQSYTVYNQFFEFLIVILGGFAWFRHYSYDVDSGTINKGVVVFLWSCVLLACSSLLLFPVSQIVRLLSLWGPFDFGSAVLSATPENALYAVAAANRLVLFSVVILLLSVQGDAKKYYEKIFQGVITGALLTTVAGVLNQWGILDLGIFRPQFHAPSGVPRLHSVAGNPGWFAQYLIGSLPFIFLLIPKNKGLFLKLAIVTVVFLFCGAALLLTASRTSWLLFPVVAVAGYLYLFFFGSGTNPNRFKGKKSLRTGLFMAAFLWAVGLCVIGAFFVIIQSGPVKGPAGSVTRTQYILHRLENIVTPGERIKVWRESLVLGSESPVFGMGYEGYKWHQRVMSSIPGSRFARSRQTINNWDTPHSFFLQLFISNGIVGVIVWFLLIFYVLYLIFRDAWFHKSTLSMMCFVSILQYLLYGLTQSLQYIPLIWFVFFLQIGYAMTLADRHVYPVAPRLRTVAAALSILLTVIGTGLYA